jgi:uncharacterized protein
MKKQVVVIHGGTTFDKYDEYLSFLKSFAIDTLDFFRGGSWKGTLEEELGDGYEVIAPQMPNKTNAKYSEWKIWFEKIVPLLGEEVILVGHSLGGIFLAKYLAEHKLGNKVSGVLLVAAPFDARDEDHTLADFELPADLGNLAGLGDRVRLYHSKDDAVVPFADLEKYRKVLPEAGTRIFEDRGHFNQEEFPELVEDIKSL